MLRSDLMLRSDFFWQGPVTVVRPEGNYCAELIEV
jgi:hypothetical protein